MPSDRTPPSASVPPPAGGAGDAARAVDDAVAHVVTGRHHWAQQSLMQRAALLRSCRDRFFLVAPRIVDAMLKMKGLTTTQPEAGEEWAFVTGTLKLFRVYAQGLDAAARGRPSVKGPWRVQTTRDGHKQVVVEVAPTELAERVALGNGRGEVWLSPGLGLSEAQATYGAHWQPTTSAASPPKVMALLAAGNVWMLLIGDLLHALCLRHVVVVGKLNPVHEVLLPLWREALAPLIEAGALALLGGDACVGARLCSHAQVDQIHMTGSHRTFEAIAFGTGQDGEQRRRRGERVHTRPMTAELGNITPVLVVPGPWTPAELRYHAVQLGSQHGLNTAFNCLTPRLIVTSSSWRQRLAFLEELRAFFDALPRRRAYYPGARARHARFVAAHPEATHHGKGVDDDDALPWTLITGLSLHAEADDLCWREESFCSVLAEATVDGDDAPTFLERAVALVHERVWGNLCVTLLVHPATQKAHAAAVDDAVAALEYGNVGVNAYATMSYVTPSLSWGAFPGNQEHDIRSGTGVVHNVLDLPHPQKSVLRGPFTVGHAPPLDLRVAQAADVLREVASLEYRPSLRAGLNVVRAALGR